MAYIPQNVIVFTAAYAGAVSALATSGGKLSESLSADISGPVAIAGAFAQAVDEAWGTNTASQLDVQNIGSACAGVFLGAYPSGATAATFDTPGFWATMASAVVTLCKGSEAYFASEAITPPAWAPPGPPGPPGQGVQYNVTAYGAVGDGVTDNTAFIEAANTAAAAAGGSVFFPGGVFYVASSFTITRPVFMDPSAQLKASPSHPVTLAAALFAAPSAYLFPGGAGSVLLTGVFAVHAQWFGAGVISDLGAAINASDLALGDRTGRIFVECNGGNIATQVLINSGHSCKLGPGTYTATCSGTGTIGYAYYGCPWTLSDNTELEGSGPTTILQETSGTNHVGANTSIVIFLLSALTTATAVPPVQNVHVHNLQTMGLPGSSQNLNAAQASIESLNCAHVWIDHCLLTNVSGFGISVGGAQDIYTPWAASTTYAVGSIILSATNYGNNGWLYKCTAVTGNAHSGGTSPTWPTVQGQTVQDNNVTWEAYQIPHAFDVHITDNKVVNAFCQPIAVVNGLVFQVDGNHLIGRFTTDTTGEAFIDCEVNTGDDLLQYWSVSNNKIDMRYGISPAVQASDMTGISINGGGGALSSNFGGGTCNNNVVIGNDMGNSVSLLAVAGIVMINLDHAMCKGNVVIGCYQVGIETSGANQTIQGNHLLNCGNFPGNRAVYLSALTNSMITGNHVYTITGSGAAPEIIELSGCSGNFIDGNYIGYPGASPAGVITTEGSSTVGRNCLNGVWCNGTAAVLPGAGASATLGAVGTGGAGIANGPQTATQYGWEAENASDGTLQWRPVWR